MVLAAFIAVHPLPLAMPIRASGGIAKAVRKLPRAFLAIGQEDDDLEDVDEACGSIGDQFNEITNQTNGTLNDLNDQVYEGLQESVEKLNLLKDAAASQKEEGTEEGIATIGDKMTALIVDMQGSVSSVQDKVVGDIDEQSSAYSVLSGKVVDSFAAAGEKVDALGDADAPTFVRRANSIFWPFSWGKKKDIYEKAEDAIIAANKTVIKIVEALDKLNASTIEAMTGMVLSKLEVASSQFQEKCEIVVTAQSDTLPEILAAQASAVCSSTDSMMNGVSSTVDQYVHFIGEKIAEGQKSAQMLFVLTERLMGKVQDTRDAADNAGEPAKP